MTVSECKCGETGGTRRPQRKRIFLHALVLGQGVGLQANFVEEYELLCAMLLFSQLV